MRFPTVVNHGVTADLQDRAASDRFHIHGIHVVKNANFVNVFVTIGGTDYIILHRDQATQFNVNIGMNAIENQVNGGIS